MTERDGQVTPGNKECRGEWGTFLPSGGGPSPWFIKKKKLSDKTKGGQLSGGWKQLPSEKRSVLESLN